MHTRQFTLILAFALSPAALLAQHDAGGQAPLVTKPPREAAQYDFLQGQWTLAVTPKVSGIVARIHGAPRLHGTWKASRALDGWGIEDELRISDDSGNPIVYTHFLRIYDPNARHWVVTSVDVYHQHVTTYTAQLQGSEMRSESEGVDPAGNPYRSRTHITDITATGFHFVQDVSHDGGATWSEGNLVMDAKRAPETATR